MRFSFLLAVVTALTTSMSVRAQCAGQNGVCGSSSAENDTCCQGLTCKLAYQRREQSIVLPVALYLLAWKTEDVRNFDLYATITARISGLPRADSRVT
ncbi:hypothetical protein BDR07DRAFT_807167 [Suillus spraguei]|nr:hypothetical protein BDR07DRAFT_807167 [Suillus spraguei]